eukprot:Gb_28302 [translate_table: standard]
MEEEVSEDRKLKHKIWRELPRDLLLRVLVFLPLGTLVRLRRVCKAWNELHLNKGLFIFLNIKQPPQPSTFLIQRSHRRTFEVSLFVFGSSAGPDCKLSLAFLPLRNPHIVAFCKGILCCRTENDLVLCNPLTKAWKIIPKSTCITVWDWNFIGMSFDAGDGRPRCRIVLGKLLYNADQDNLTKLVAVQMYDSATDAWELIYRGTEHWVGVCSRVGVYSEGKLYWVAERWNYFCLIAFDVESRRWEEIEPSERDYNNMYFFGAKLVGCEGTVLVMEKLYNSNVRYWKLKLEGGGRVCLSPVVMSSSLRAFHDNLVMNKDEFCCVPDGTCRIVICDGRGTVKRILPDTIFGEGFGFCKVFGSVIASSIGPLLPFEWTFSFVRV